MTRAVSSVFLMLVVGGSVPQVLLCASNQNNSIVECWSLRKEGLPVNNIFQQISPVGKCLHWGLSRAGAWSEGKSSPVSHIHYPVSCSFSGVLSLFCLFAL